MRWWEGKDISHLNTLVRLTVNWIDSVLFTEEFKDDMPDPKRVVT